MACAPAKDCPLRRALTAWLGILLLLAPAHPSLARGLENGTSAAPGPSPGISFESQTPLATVDDDRKCTRLHDLTGQQARCRVAREDCDSGGLVPYLELYACRVEPAGALARGAFQALCAAVLIMLFRVLASTAEEFFSPILTQISQELGLPPRFAGVTFLALGNGAPDLSASIAAVRSGRTSLALGSLLGGGMFVGCVVAGGVVLTSGGAKARGALLRDVTAYGAATALVVALLLTGTMTRAKAWLLLLAYAAFVVVVLCADVHRIWTDRSKAEGEGAAEPLLLDKGDPQGLQQGVSARHAAPLVPPVADLAHPPGGAVSPAPTTSQGLSGTEVELSGAVSHAPEDLLALRRLSETTLPLPSLPPPTQSGLLPTAPALGDYEAGLPRRESSREGRRDRVAHWLHHEERPHHHLPGAAYRARALAEMADSHTFLRRASAAGEEEATAAQEHRGYAPPSLAPAARASSLSLSQALGDALQHPSPLDAHHSLPPPGGPPGAAPSRPPPSPRQPSPRGAHHLPPPARVAEEEEGKGESGTRVDSPFRPGLADGMPSPAPRHAEGEGSGGKAARQLRWELPTAFHQAGGSGGQQERREGEGEGWQEEEEEEDEAAGFSGGAEGAGQAAVRWKRRLRRAAWLAGRGLAGIDAALRAVEYPLTVLRRATVPLVEAECYNWVWLLVSLLLAPPAIALYLGASWPAALGALGLGAAASGGAGLATRHDRTTPPRWGLGTGLPLGAAAVALLGFLAAALWIDLVATELVALLDFFGVVWGVDHAVLGQTVLAWGNSVGDLSTDLAMARRGLPNMAMTACYAGPVFTLLVSLGAGFLALTSAAGSSPGGGAGPPGGAVAVGLGRGPGVSAGFIILMCGSLVATGLLCGLRLPRATGLALLALYALYMAVSLGLYFGAK